MGVNDASKRFYDPGAFAGLASAEAGHWWFRSRNRLILWALQRQTGRVGTLLEIGCGTGYVLEGIDKAFPAAELYASDYFEEGLQFARARVPRAHFRQLDATRLDDEARYDVILACDVLEHIEADERVLRNIERALRPGGSFLITVPQHAWLWSPIDEHARHVRRYSRDELLDKLDGAGLRPRLATSFVTLLLPLMWLARLRARVGPLDPMAEFRISAWLNFVLERTMTTERWLIEAGVRLPAGGSLLFVGGRK